MHEPPNLATTKVAMLGNHRCVGDDVGLVVPRGAVHTHRNGSELEQVEVPPPLNIDVGEAVEVVALPVAPFPAAENENPAHELGEGVALVAKPVQKELPVTPAEDKDMLMPANVSVSHEEARGVRMLPVGLTPTTRSPPDPPPLGSDARPEAPYVLNASDPTESKGTTLVQ
jgi:hypothetical protein